MKSRSRRSAWAGKMRAPTRVAARARSCSKEKRTFVLFLGAKKAEVAFMARSSLGLVFRQVVLDQALESGARMRLRLGIAHQAARVNVAEIDGLQIVGELL